MAAANGTEDDAGAFEWRQEYDSVLQQIARADVVETEWKHLREMIKYRINNNTRQYLSGDCDVTIEMGLKKSSGPVAQRSPVSLPPSSPPTFTPSPTPQGLIIPPFPNRERKKGGSIRILKNNMDEKEVDDSKAQIFEQLEEFDSDPPFTIQRLCELCVEPRKHYKTVGKYLRAVERTILVTSTRDMYPSIIDIGDIEMAASIGDNETLRLATTPLFSPIPFLHDDARRSRSPSPFELAATKRPPGPHDDRERPCIDLSGARPGGLGLVDELDDPKPGHLADHPTALTTATSARHPLALTERFVKSTSPGPEPEEVLRDVSESADLRQAEDAEVEGMVLDDNSLEDEDKENRPS